MCKFHEEADNLMIKSKDKLATDFSFNIVISEVLSFVYLFIIVLDENNKISNLHTDTKTHNY